VLGAIVGALILLGPLSGSPTFIVQAFWLAMTGAVLLGRWPNGVPPAWTTGVAAPWPSQQELREQRGARGGRGDRGRASAPADAAPRPPAAAGSLTESPSPATSSRKKRKRRG
jgi:hypothetical protein